MTDWRRNGALYGAVHQESEIVIAVVGAIDDQVDHARDILMHSLLNIELVIADHISHPVQWLLRLNGALEDELRFDVIDVLA